MYKENKIVQPRAVNNTDGKGVTFFFTLPTINSSPAAALAYPQLHLQPGDGQG